MTEFSAGLLPFRSMSLFCFSHFRCSFQTRSPILCYVTRHFSQQKDSGIDNYGIFACRLQSRSVIRFRGPDTNKFLEGLLTNDVCSVIDVGQGGDPKASFSSSVASYVPTPNAPFRLPPPKYAAMLTPRGRFLYDIFLYRTPLLKQTLSPNGDGYIRQQDQEELFSFHADVDASILDEIMVYFRKYKLRSKVDIENVSENYSCWQLFGGKVFENKPIQEFKAAAIGWGGGIDLSGMPFVHGCCEGWQWYRDPRLECLGFRGIFPSNTIPPLGEVGKVVDEQHYLLWRIERGVPEGSTEIPKGEAIPLEYNMEGLNAISFNKGCYVGQELVARTHHRGVIRKRLLPLIFREETGKELDQEVSLGSEIVIRATNKKVGTVNIVFGSRGMGLLKLETLEQPSTLAIKERIDVSVKTFRPEWWPAEWTQCL